jgi:ribosomal protein L44E
MDLNDITLVVLILIFAWIGIVWFLDSYGKKKCRYCRKGTMQEVEAVPEGMMHSSPHQSSGITVVRYKVKYQCTHCKEFVVVSESRK